MLLIKKNVTSTFTSNKLKKNIKAYFWFKKIKNKKIFCSNLKIYNPLINFKIPNFINVQRNSFKKFLEIGLINEFKNLKNITNSNKTIEILFHINKYKLNPPKLTIRQCILRKKTYNCQLYIPLQIINHNTQKSIIDWLLIMNLPLMTKNGHFIINGSPKIIMNQIVRSPGIYFQKLIKPDQQIFYSADFIAQRGTWLRLEIDSKSGEIWAKMKKTSKIPINVFLRCLGISLPIFNNYLTLYESTFNKYTNSKLNNLIATNKKKQEYSIQNFFYIKENSILNTKQILNINNINENFEEFSKKISLKSKLKNINNNKKELGKKFLYEKFLNPRLYSLSKVGRLRINKKLGINISNNHTLLTAKDILFSCFYLIQCFKGIEIPTDIDDLKNRKIRSCGKLIQLQLATAILRFEKIFRDKLILNEKINKPNNFIFCNNKLLNGFIINRNIANCKLLVKKDQKTLIIKDSFFYNNLKKNFYFYKYTREFQNFKKYYNKKKENLKYFLEKNSKSDKLKKSKIIDFNLEIFINSKLFNNSLRDFFNTNPLVQLLDQTNPLAEITHKRRLSSLGPGGITRDTAGMAIRGIHPTHYGRICPIETPEGQNAGLVNSFTIYSYLNSDGSIETPFYKIYKGFILINLGLILLSSDKEKNYHIAPSDIKKTKLNFLPSKVDIPCRQLKEFKRISRNNMDYIAISPIQMISIATSLIPFLEHNDGNRALMGSNMQRQAVPTLKPSFPIVGTGLESKIIANINHSIQAKYAGLIIYVDGKEIIISSYKKKVFNSLINNSLDYLNKLKTFSNKKLFKLDTKKKLINRNNKINKINNNIQNFYFIEQKKNFILKNKIKNKKLNLFGFNKFIYKKKINNIKLKKKLRFYKKKKKTQDLRIQLFFSISKENCGFFSFIFFEKIKKENYYNKIIKKNSFLLNDFSLLNSKNIYTIFNLYFNDYILYIFEIITIYSKKLVYNKILLKNKSFLSKNNIYFLNKYKKTNIIVNYSKLILNNSPLITYLIINILNIYYKNKLVNNNIIFSKSIVFNENNKINRLFYSKNKPNNILFPVFFKNVLNKINRYDYYNLTLKINKYINYKKVKNYIFKNTNWKIMFYLYINKKKKIHFIINSNIFKYLWNFNLTFLPIFYLNKIKIIVNSLNLNYKNKITLETRKTKKFSTQTDNTNKYFFYPIIKKQNYKNNIFFIQNKLCKKNLKKKNIFKSLYLYYPKYFNFKNFKLNYYTLENLINNKNGNYFIKQPLTLDIKNILKKQLIRKQKLIFDYYNLKNKKKLIKLKYKCEQFNRSNQDTYLVHKPNIKKGQWVENGDILADNSTSVKGELSIGQNLLVGYLPWEGYNFEDAVLINQRLIYDDIFTSLHIERYETEVRETQFGPEEITCRPNKISVLNYLNTNGIIKLGTWVQEGDILVGKISPIGKKKLSAYEKLLYDIIGKSIPKKKDTSLKVPLGVKGRVIHIEIIEKNIYNFSNKFNYISNKNKIKKNLLENKNFFIYKFLKNKKNFKNDKILDNLKKLLKNNFIKIKKNKKLKNKLKNKFYLNNFNNLFYKNIKINFYNLSRFNKKLYYSKERIKKSLLKISANIKNFLIKKNRNKIYYYSNILKKPNTIGPFSFKKIKKYKSKIIKRKKILLFTIYNIININKLNLYLSINFLKLKKKNNSFFLINKIKKKEFIQKIFEIKGLKINYLRFFHNTLLLNELSAGDFLNKNIFYFFEKKYSNLFKTSLYNIFLNNSFSIINKQQLNNIKQKNSNIKIKKPIKIYIYIAEKRKIKIGDKIAGRHGNKGIISNILPCENMPYLPDGTPLDLVLNPLGVPSRMNVGQIFECLLGLAGAYLNQCYKIQPFDEIYGFEASRSLVYSKLYEACIKTGQYWLFNSNFPGKIRLFDGRTGICFEQPSTIGKAYILKLIHQVDEKIHARSTGPYSLITQQPLRGRSKQGGQRIGEMEVWALEGFGASYILQELLTIKSDDISGRNKLTKSILNNKSLQSGTPESFKVLVRELQALCLDLSIYKLGSKGKSKKIDINFL